MTLAKTRPGAEPWAKRPPRSFRARIWLFLKIATGSTLALGIAGGVVLHLDLAVTRRLVARTANRALLPVFNGRITIEALGQLGLDGFTGARVRIDDPHGRPVLTADGVHARIRAWKLLRTLIGGSKTLDIEIPEASVEHADLVLDTDEVGMPLIKHALTPAASAQATPQNGEPGKLVRLVITHATAKHVWVHGEPTWAPPVDLEVADAEGKVVVSSSGSVEIDIRRGQVLARAVPAFRRGTGSVRGRVLVPSEHGNDVGIDASFEGSLGGIDESAHFSLDGNVIGASLDIKEVAPATVRVFLPDYPVQERLAAHIDAHGTFPDLDVEARAQLSGGGVFAASGSAVLSQAKRAILHAKVAAIDLRGLAPGMPVSSLGAGIDATFVLDDQSELTGTATIVSEGGTLGGQVLPAAEVKATFSSGVRGPRIDGHVDATVTMQDPGLMGSAKLRLYPKGKSFELGFDARASASRLNAVPRFPLNTRGSVVASARGTLSFDSFALAADVEARAHDLEPGAGARVQSASGTAHVGGTIFSPRIDAKVHAVSLDLADAHSDRADVTAVGLITSPHVHVGLDGGNLPDLEADADVSLGATTVLRDLRAGFSRREDRAELRADVVRITSGSFRADRISIDGLGGPVQGQLRVVPHAIEVVASGKEVDVGRLARLGGLEAWCTGGKLAFDIDAKVRGAMAEGNATFDLTDATVIRVQGASAHGQLSLKDRELSGRARVELGSFGTMDVVGSELHMGKEGASSLRSWQRVWGAVELNAKVDMARLEEILPEGSLPVRILRGQLELAGRLKRDSMNDDTPHFALTANTAQLVMENKGDDKQAKSAPPTWRIEGLDFGVDARIDGESGFAELAGRVMDAKGPLLAIDAKSAAMPYSALLATPSRARELLSGVKLDATFLIPRRELATFPAVFQLAGTDGELEAELTLHGTLTAPEVNLKASLGQARASATRFSFPVDLALTSHYAAGHTDAHLLATTARRGEVMNAEAHAEGRLTDLLLQPREAAWEASGRAHLAAFPLGGVGFIEDRQVRGFLSGDIVLEGLHRDAKATLDLAATDFQIGNVSYKDASLQAVIDGHTLDAKAHFDHTDGSADAHATAGASWGSAFYPSFVEGQPVDLSVSARQFRAETLLPFAHETLAELEGRIDGTAHLVYDRQANKTELDGRVVYSHGKLELSSALGELHDATATLVLTPDGVLRLENASAAGVTGRVEAAGTARLSTGKEGLMLGAARARVQISKGSPMPITLEGTPLGTIDGTLDLSEDPTPDHRGMAVVIDVPRLHVQLPESGSRSLQPLGELDADVGVRHGSRELVLVPLGPPREQKTRAADARRIEITARLGSDVEVRRGAGLKVGLEGQPTATVSDKVHVTGQIRLRKGGLLEVQGKSFEIEKGTVTFVGDDPENPQVVVTAGWTAPDGTRIYADYVGPLKTGKVTLRSEPPFAQTDIVALLLFGTPEGQSGAGGQGATNSATGSAVGAAGGVVTQPINHALDQFGVHALAARVDTSQAANPKPEVELQIAKDLSVQIAQVIGTPPPGANPDTTLLTLNWRLLRGLTVSTTVGNLGSSIVDMVWERRY